MQYKLSQYQKAVKTAAYTIIILGALTMLVPYLWMFFTSFKTSQEAFAIVPKLLPNQWQTEAYVELFSKYNIFRATLNTLTIEFVVIVTGTIVSSAAAFAFAKLRMPHKKTLLLILLSSMMIPYATVMLPQYRVFQSLGLTDTLWPLILPGLFGNVAMMFFMIQYMRGIPSALIEAAKIDGASYPRILFQIVLPLAKPALAAQIVFWFVGIWNDYFAPSIYLTTEKSYTLQVLLSSLNSSYGSGVNFPLVMAGAFVSSLPMIALFIGFQKYFIQSSASVGIKE